MTWPAARSDAASPSVGVVTVAYHSDDVLDGLPRVARRGERGPARDRRRRQRGRAEHARDRPRCRRDLSRTPVEPRLRRRPSTRVCAALPASVEWVLFATRTSSSHAGVIDVLRVAGDADPAIATVGPVVLNPDGTIYPSARAVPSLRTGVGHALFANLWHGNPWTLPYRAGHDRRLRSPRCRLALRVRVFSSGAAHSTRSAGSTRATSCTSRTSISGSDSGRRGYRNRYEPEVGVTHLGAHSTSSESARMVRAHHESARRFLRKKYAGWYLWPVRATLAVGLAARSAWVVRRARQSKRTG